ncbi:porin [Flavobacterium sp. '19STA2R22 D10 B1']|uniref:porin n=1 Tax=Flavobacterium aerium TaxID=3037261 RepID=UPI00278C1A6F|nr:porin [Flavobacterium sp. '19STA2R22 D10 B1']
MKKIIIAAMALISLQAIAQDTIKNPLTFSGYVEGYYSYDFGKPANHVKNAAFYNFNKHNEVNLNLGVIKAAYANDKVRGNLALMVGTYAEYNLAAEQGLLKNVYEANIGVKISEKHNLWVDLGIMPSHIGFESAIGKDCWTLTRSILAENSPYFEAGVKVGYTTPNQKLYVAAMYLNGWQRIQRVEGNQTPAFGTQVTYKPNSSTTLNWSTYIVNEQNDTIKKWRYFNNVFVQHQFTEKLGLIAGFDIGIQQQAKGSNQYNVWYSPVAIVQYKPTDKTRMAARVEYYTDKHGVIIPTGTENGFKTTGYSLNFDYLPMENVLFRIEGRMLDSKDKIFLNNENPSFQNYSITTSLALSF